MTGRDLLSDGVTVHRRIASGRRPRGSPVIRSRNPDMKTDRGSSLASVSVADAKSRPQRRGDDRRSTSSLRHGPSAVYPQPFDHSTRQHASSSE